jgi:hypothetical protein
MVNFIKNNYFVFLIVAVIFLIYLVEKISFNSTVYFVEMIILKDSYAYCISIVLIIFYHIKLLKYVVSSMLFPCGYYFSNWLVTIGLFEDTLRLLEIDLNFLKKYKECYFLLNDPNPRVIELFDTKIKNFKKFAKFLKQIQKIYNDYEKNKISEFNTQLLEEFQNLNASQEKNLKTFSEILDIYKTTVEKYREQFSRWEYKKLFNFLKIRFQSYFDKIIEKFFIDKDLYFYILKPKKTNPSVLLIFNNPNAMCAEFYSLNQNLMNLYLKNNIAILLWNYQGYGERKGNTSIKNIKSDSEKIMEYIIKHLSKQYTKIGVHGVSMGGIAACHLAGKYNNISFLIEDRTFSSLDKVIQHSMPCGGFLKYLYNFLYFENFKDRFANTLDYMNSTCKNKLLLYDSQDEIIPFESSLKYEYTEFLFEKNIKNEIIKYLEECDKKKISRSENKSDNKLNLSCDISTLNLIKKIFTNEELEKLKLKFFHIMRYYSNKREMKNNIDRNNTDTGVYSNKEIDHEFLEKFFNNFLFQEHSYINVTNIYENFNSYLKDFLLNLFVWGHIDNQLPYDENGKIFDSHLCKSHYKSVPIILLNFYKEVSSFTYNLESEREATVTQELNFLNYGNKNEDIINHLNDFIEIFISKINLIFYKFYFIPNNKNSRYSIDDEDILKFHYNLEMINSQEIKSHLIESRKNVGYIINLSCGHNGEYSTKERREILNFINSQHLN